MLYLEFFAEHGVGWRVPIPDGKITQATNGKMTLRSLSVPIDETCTLMPKFRLVTDMSPLTHMLLPPGEFMPMAEGHLNMATMHMMAGQLFTIDEFTLSVSSP